MTLSERLQKVAVIGAGGKMGSGISLLLAQEMTLQKLIPENSGRDYTLYLMDVNPAALEGLRQYLHTQGRKFVQKNSERLSHRNPLLAAADAADRFIDTLDGIIKPVTDLNAVAPAHLVFEAILEKMDLKLKVYRDLQRLCATNTYFFSNTSSIPIKEIDEGAALGGRLIGFHFYNPPAIQKLVELITPATVAPELPELARSLGERLGKIIIPANDVAGFIGNGHFMRDGLHGITEAQRLTGEMPLANAIYIVNRISRDFLVRPMGIFQLIDYVGLDIFQSILAIMDPHFPEEPLHSELIDQMVTAGIKGGQFPNGSQKDGFLKYEDGKPVGVYDLDDGRYRLFVEGGWKARADEQIGSKPAGHMPWKALLGDPDREANLAAYFANLHRTDTMGARLAVDYLKRSKSIGEGLLSAGVATTPEDVNGVLTNGFFHLYGPINPYV